MSVSMTTGTRAFGIAIIFSLALHANAREWTEIRIATEGAYAPWNFTNASGDLVGFELDLAKDPCTRLNARCAIVRHPWRGIIRGLDAGMFDAIMAGMSITQERRRSITFTRAYAAAPLETEQGAKLTIIGPRLAGGPFGEGVAAGVRKKDQDLADCLSEAIEGAIGDGTVTRLSMRWFGFDVSPSSIAP
jgi:octopine/nopaline transport system substrate-binding protein